MSPLAYVDIATTTVALICFVFFVYARNVYRRAYREHTQNSTKLTELINEIEIKPHDAPDAPEVDELVIAYRGYSLQKLSGLGDKIDYVLTGSYEAIWYGPELTATHQGSEAQCRLHLSQGSCACGIYALRDRLDVAASSRVIAEVVLAGWVIPGSKGYRAEWARIQHLWVYEDTLEVRSALSQRYECPVDVLEGSFPYMPYMGHGPSVSLGQRAATPVPEGWSRLRLVKVMYATLFPTPDEVASALVQYQPFTEATPIDYKTTPNGEIMEVTYKLKLI